MPLVNLHEFYFCFNHRVCSGQLLSRLTTIFEFVMYYLPTFVLDI